MRTAIPIILGVIFLGLFLACAIWLALTVKGLHCIRRADYRVSVPDKPMVSGDVYRIRVGRYLVVLREGSGDRYEAYDVDLDRMQVGVPSFDPAKHRPFSWGAITDERALEGYPLEGSLAATWRVTDREVLIRITGFSSDLIRAGTVSGDPNVVARKLMPVAYETEIALAKAE